MRRTLLPRLAELLVTLLLLTMLSFALVKSINEQALLDSLRPIPEIYPSFLEALRRSYQLDRPIPFQYWTWLSGLFRGDWGYAIRWDRPIIELVGPALRTTIVLYVPLLPAVLALSWRIVRRAVRPDTDSHRRSWLTTGLSLWRRTVPTFLLALVLLLIPLSCWDRDLKGLFSYPYHQAPWNLDRIHDLAAHLALPLLALVILCAAECQHVWEKERDESQSASRPVEAVPSWFRMIHQALPEIASHAVILSCIFGWPTLGTYFAVAAMGSDTRSLGVIFLIISSSVALGRFLLNAAEIRQNRIDRFDTRDVS